MSQMIKWTSSAMKFPAVILLLLFITVLRYGSATVYLRKHRHQFSAPNERAVVGAMRHAASGGNTGAQGQDISYDKSPSDACGESTLSCMAFAHKDEPMPVRCGMLRKAPLCKRKDENGNEQCDVFCDADG